MSESVGGTLRRCEIYVVGNNNFPAEGADISFTLDGTFVGYVRQSRGHASILPPAGYSQLEVTATLQGVSETMVLTPATTQATIVLGTPGAVIKAIIPTTPTCPRSEE